MVGFFGKEAWYFIYIGNVWKLFVDIKQKNYYFDWIFALTFELMKSSLGSLNISQCEL